MTSSQRAVNKIIKYNLKTKLEYLKGRLADELSEVLWAYRTKTKYEAMVSAEIGVGSYKGRITT